MEAVEASDEEEELSVLLWPVFVLFHVGTVDYAVLFTSVKCFVVKFFSFFTCDFFATNFVSFATFFDD